MADKGKRVRAKRNIVKMEITDAGKASIKHSAEQLAMKEQAVLGRLVQWFYEQPDVVRKEVLGVLPEGYEVDILEIALKRHRERKAQQQPKK